MDPALRRLLPVYALLFMRNLAWSTSLSGPVMPLYVRSLGLDVRTWGFLATSLAAGLFCFEAFWGSLSDRVDRRLFLLLALVGLTAIYPLYTFPALLPFFFLFQFALGAFTSIIGPTSRAMIMDGAPAESKGFFVSLWVFSAGLGQIIGPMLGTYMATTYGYPYAFYTSTCILAFAVAVFGAAYALDRRNGVERKPVEPRPPMLTSLKRILSIRSLRVTCLIAVSMYMMNSAYGSFLPLYASERIGLTALQVGAVFTTAAAINIVATPLLGRASDRVSRRSLLTVVFAAAGVLFSLYVYVGSAAVLTAVSAGVALCTFSSTLTMAIHNLNTPKDLTGMSIGVYGTCEDLGLILGGVVYGYAWSAFGPGSVFIIASLFGLTCVALSFLVREEKR